MLALLEQHEQSRNESNLSPDEYSAYGEEYESLCEQVRLLQKRMNTLGDTLKVVGGQKKQLESGTSPA